MAFSAAGGAVPSSAIEPIQRTGAARVKFSLAAYSFRGLLTGTKPKMTLHDFVDDCAKMPLEAAELTSYYFPKEVTGAYLAALKQHCFRQGLDVSGTAVGNDFCHGPGEARDRQIASVRRWVEHAAALGAPVIRIFSGSRRPTQSEAEAHRLAVAGIEQCCEYAGKHGVTLALENHGGLTSTVEGMLKLIHDVKSSALGVNMDTGNFHSTDVYADLERIAPYSVNVQVKVAVRSAGGRKQPADYARIAKILKRAGYRGYVALEFEESGDPRIECRKHIEQLRSAFSKVL
jgi:sugar phosphate isomerase/epimerase